MKTESPRRAVLLAILSALAVATPLALAVVDETHTPARAYLDGAGPGFRDLTAGDFTAVNCDPETWTWKDGVIHCTGTTRGRDSHHKAGRQFRAGRRVAAPAVGREFGNLRLGSREGARGHQAQLASAGRHRGANPRSRVQGAIRKAVRQEGDLVHDRWRRLSGRDVENDPVPSGVARWQPQLSRRNS